MEHSPTTETNVAVVELSDDRLREGLASLRWGIDDILATGESTLVIDIDQVARLSSVSIAVILWAKRCCSARHVRVVIKNPTRRSLETLRNTGLAGVIDVEVGETRSSGWAKSLRGAFCA